MTDDVKKKIKELKRLEEDLRRLEQERESLERAIKERLLAGATIEPGARDIELRTLPGREPGSKNPDDYALIISLVS